MHAVRIYEIPNCKMVSSKIGMFGDGSLESFDAWFSTLPRGIHPKDYLFFDTSIEDNHGFRWLYLYEAGMSIPSEFSVIDFQGGLYAVVTDIDEQTDMAALYEETDAFLLKNNLERDTSRPVLGNIITSPSAKEILGYLQMNHWIPIAKKKQ